MTGPAGTVAPDVERAIGILELYGAAAPADGSVPSGFHSLRPGPADRHLGQGAGRPVDQLEIAGAGPAHSGRRERQKRQRVKLFMPPNIYPCGVDRKENL